MTVQQAIDRVASERLEGIYATEWTMTREDIEELLGEMQAGIYGECGHVPLPNDDMARARLQRKTKAGYSLTFMGIDIYRP